MPGPTFSVVVPTFERVEFLARAIESVLAQTCRDLEVVVVDDGPSEPIAALVRAHPDGRVRLVRHDRNRGVAAARNTGIAAAAGMFVGFLDDDDLWLPAKLERQLQVIEERNADVVHTLVYVTDADGNVYEEPTQRGFRLFRQVAAAGYPYDLLLRRSSFFINTFVVRRERLESIGGFDESLASVDDLDLVHRLRRGNEFHLVDEPLVKYCFHARKQSYVRDPYVWTKLAAKELDWLGEAQPPRSRETAAYLYMQTAQAAWIGSRYRAAVRPALQARRLDLSVISDRTVAKYLAAACLPGSLVDAARRRSRAAVSSSEPDPWLDL
jgi:glycosyltransferase involved in cell wall biosynthesis